MSKFDCVDLEKLGSQPNMPQNLPRHCIYSEVSGCPDPIKLVEGRFKLPCNESSLNWQFSLYTVVYDFYNYNYIFWSCVF